MKSELLQQALEKITKQTAGIVELSDEALANVSGGSDKASFFPDLPNPIVWPTDPVPAPDPALQRQMDQYIEKINNEVNRGL